MLKVLRMVLQIQLSEDQAKALRKIAEQRGVGVKELVAQSAVDLIDKADDPEFDAILGRVLTRNDELYRRLAE